LYDSFNFASNPRNSTTSGGSYVNNTVISYRLEAYLCPSDVVPQVNWLGAQTYIGPQQYPGNNYRWCGGRAGIQRIRDGLFTRANTIKGTRDVIDGTAFTAAFSERVIGAQFFGGVQTPKNYYYSMATDAGTAVPVEQWLTIFADSCRQLNTPKPNGGANYNISGGFWAMAAVLHTGYVHTMTPNERSCLGTLRGTAANLSPPRGTHRGATTATSFHPGGVNVLMADGTVRFVSDGVDRSVWWAIASTSNQETVSNASF
jgi:prepilin-type processing-associated H-X9-DG protein